MSKIILSSCDFRNEQSAEFIYKNLPIPAAECRVLYFPNEKATEASINSTFYYKRLEEFGFQKNNVYVFNYFNPAEFDIQNDIDVIYISGGNTFGTLKIIREVGAEKIILDYINRGTMYIGGSAGAHIASRSIAHVSKYDTDTYGIQDFSGLKLFDGILICHYSEDRKSDYEELLAAGENNVVALRDQDYMMIEKGNL